MALLHTGLIIAGGVIVLGAAVYAGIQIYKSIKAKDTSDSPETKAKQDFSQIADTFSGLYEPLYKMANGQIKYRIGVVGDWVTRTRNLTKAENYTKEWGPRFEGYENWEPEKGLETVKALMSFVFGCGVVRDSVSETVVDNETYRKYNTSDGELIESGDSARVVSPFWFTGDTIVEKGIIESKI